MANRSSQLMILRSLLRGSQKELEELRVQSTFLDPVLPPAFPYVEQVNEDDVKVSAGTLLSPFADTFDLFVAFYSCLRIRKCQPSSNCAVAEPKSLTTCSASVVTKLRSAI
jgi:hypothetical protein